MPRSGQATKEKILDAAEELVFAHGFSATSLDNVLERAALTKGAFFYHFKSKAELGCALIERFAARDREFLETTMARAEKLSADPVQQLLVFVGLVVEPFEQLAEPAPGCLFASYIYQPLEFSDEVAGIARETILEWRTRLLEKLEAICARSKPRVAVDLEALADHLTVVVEGSYIVSKVLEDPGLLARQLEQYRHYLELLLLPEQPPVG